MNKRPAKIQPYPTIMLRVAKGSEAEELLFYVGNSSLPLVYLPPLSDDTLHKIGGQALINAKYDGVKYAFYAKVDESELDVKFPLEAEQLWNKVTHARLLELVAAFDAVGRAEIGDNNYGEYLFLTLHIGADFYTFYGLGERNDGKIERENWHFYRSTSSIYRDKPVLAHATVMQTIIDRRREVDTWEDPPKSQTQRTDTLLDIAGGDADFAALLDEEFGDEFDEE